MKKTGLPIGHIYLMMIVQLRLSQYRSDETSHLPMRQALTNGDANEKLAAEQYLRELKILSTIK